jgi:hypothetical protein
MITLKINYFIINMIKSNLRRYRVMYNYYLAAL